MTVEPLPWFDLLGILNICRVSILIVVAVLVIAVSLTGGVPATGFLFGQQTATPQPGSGSGSPYAKNVILMIGDGMGRNQTEAARWEKSGNDMATYRSTSLAMDGLDYTGNVSTASANSAVTDSAAGATALMTGVRTDNGVIGQDETAVKGVSDGARLTTIAELAKAKGRATGVVTTSRITDATPAGVYAHVNDRDDEMLIADQLLASGVDVALGGGYRYFINNTGRDPWEKKGRRTDGRDLVAEARAQGYTIVTDASLLNAAPETPGTRVLGIFDSLSMANESVRAETQQPSLADMAGKALSVLAADPDGFFLTVEGGQIDTTANANNKTAMIGEVLAFDDAVRTALAFADAHPDTLLIVTADHETGGMSAQQNGDGTLSFSFTTTSHTADDVPIRASGPGAERFNATTVRNTRVFDILRDEMDL